MQRFHHILFPVDFSPACQSMAPAVKLMARKFDAKVTLLHVLRPSDEAYAGLEVGCPVAPAVEAARRDAEERLAQFFALPDPSLPRAVEAVVEVGDASRVISSFAKQKDVDLIMMPTHGCGTFRGLLLGSVTAKVLHDAACPVWTDAHVETSPLAAALEFRVILCAVDVTPESVELVKEALGLARELGGQLRLVHAVPAAENDPPARMYDSYRRFLLDLSREEISKLQQKAGVHLQACILAGPVSKVVRHAILHHDADMVIMGRGKLQNMLGRLRTNAYTIIRDAPCPVLSV